MKLLIGSDHAGYKLKEDIKKFAKKLGHEILDYGTNSEEPVDYPDISERLAKDVVRQNEKGILVCGSGTGMSISANKIKGARAALCYDEFTAKVSREHNDANILCLAGRDMTLVQARRITKAWLEAEFSGEERHRRRVEKIKRIETKNLPSSKFFG